MKVFALIFIICSLICVHSQDDFTQQVTLSCPSNPKFNKGQTGFPGKRGSRGDPGSKGKCKLKYGGFLRFFCCFNLVFGNLPFSLCNYFKTTTHICFGLLTCEII